MIEELKKIISKTIKEEKKDNNLKKVIKVIEEKVEVRKLGKLSYWRFSKTSKISFIVWVLFKKTPFVPLVVNGKWKGSFL